MAFKTGAVTVRFVLPMIPFRVAVTMAVPAATVVATPLLALMVATPVADELQVAVVVMTAVVPSEYLPVATKLTVFEKPTTDELAGVTAIASNAGTVTVSSTVPLLLPATPAGGAMVAEIVALPVAASALASPLLAGSLLTVATAVSVEDQTASKVRSCVVESEKVPLTTNWVDLPLGRAGGATGVIVIAVTVALETVSV